MRSIAALSMWVGVVGLGLAASDAKGQIVATPTLVAADDASQPAYNDGWQAGDNGGFGFLPWAFTTLPNPATPLVNSSTLNGDGIDDGVSNGLPGDADIDSGPRNGGRAWGAFFSGTNGLQMQTLAASRALTAPVADGHAFSADLDTGLFGGGFGGVNAGAGLRFLSPAGALQFSTDGSGYLFNNTVVSSLPYTDEGLTVTYTRQGNTGYALTATLANGLTDTFTGTLAQPVTGIEFISFNNGATAGHNVYLNSLSVTTPEPAAALWVLAAAVLTRRRPAAPARLEHI